MSRGRLCRLVSTVGVMSALAACSSGAAGPATLTPGGDSCAFCRMTISDPRIAGQLVQSGEEPRFFDDIGCLANYISRSAGHLSAAVAYVADHRTGEWVRASRAIYVRHPALDTPMGSHLVAYMDDRSRAGDDRLKDGETASIADVFGKTGPPDGQP